MRKQVLVHPIILFAFLWLLLEIAVYIIAFPIDRYNNEGATLLIQLLSIYGILKFGFSVFSWKSVTKKIICGYIIFLLFAFLFTFGQCFMWAIGIHSDIEIGIANLYIYAKATAEEIIKTQIYTIIGLSVFHFGALIAANRKKQAVKFVYDENHLLLDKQVLKLVCGIACLISTPLQYYSMIITYQYTRAYGYGALLYNVNAQGAISNIVELVQMIYIPSIIGLLIASNFEKKIKIICYTNFIIYCLLSVISGNRGEWLVPLLILFWISNQYNKKINPKKAIIYIVVGLIIVVFASAIRDSRDYGLSISSLADAIKSESNPVSAAFFEMGGAMRPTLLMIREGTNIYPYGNTYLLALLGMFTEKITTLFIPGYIGVGSWYSQVYLRISYGAGFSFLAEAFLNFGPYLSLIFLLVLGFFISKLFNTESFGAGNKYSKIFFQVSSVYCLIEGIRNTMLHALKTWIFSVILIYIIVLVINNIRVRYFTRGNSRDFE